MTTIPLGFLPEGTSYKNLLCEILWWIVCVVSPIAHASALWVVVAQWSADL